MKIFAQNFTINSLNKISNSSNPVKSNLKLSSLNKDTVSFTSQVDKRKEAEEELLDYLSNAYFSYVELEFGSPEYNKALDLMVEEFISPEDATDLVNTLGVDDDEAIQKALKINEWFDREIGVYYPAKFVKFGLDDDDINLLVDEVNEESINLDNLTDLLTDKDALMNVLAIKKSFMDMSLDDSFDLAVNLKFDSEKINQALSFVEEVNHDDFTIYESCEYVEEEYTYKPDEIKKACELLANNPILYFDTNIWSLIDIQNTYSKNEINDAIELMNDNEKFFSTVSLLEVLQTDRDFMLSALEFAKKENIPLKEASSYVYQIQNPKQTSKDDVYPRELSDDEIVQKFESGLRWDELVYDMYSQIRRTNDYAVDYGADNYSGKYGDFYKSIYNPTKRIEIYNDGTWSSRAPHNFIDTPIERISLNVKGDAELVKKLDSYMYNTRKFSYKLFQSPSKWADREDPITLYFSSEISDKTFNEIAEITKPYARGKINGVDKNSKTPWIDKEKYAFGNVVDELKDRAIQFDDELYWQIQSDAGYSNSLSTGQYRAYCKIMDEYQRYLNIKNN